MQNIKTTILTLSLAIIGLLGVSYVQATGEWIGPTVVPTGANTPAPINIGTQDQVKTGGLSVENLIVNNASVLNGNVGIGTNNPSTKLEVKGGAIKATDGLIIQNGAPANPKNGQIWIRLTN